MSSNVIFLGTAADSLSVSRQIRCSGGIIFEYNDLAFLINPGPGTLVRARQFGYNLRKLIGIMLTDNNLITSNDINAVIDAMTYSGEDKRGILIGPKESFESENRFLNEDYKKIIEKIIYMEPQKKIAIDDIEIYGLKTNKLINVGYKFITPDFTLCYLPDPVFSIELADDLIGCDVLVIGLKHEEEAKLPQDNKLSFKQVANIISTAKPRLTVISDYSHNVIEADPINQARMLQKQTGMQVISAKDGMVFNPKSYSKPKRDSRYTLYIQGRT
jgi:ribonuclease BN (tRNA processing enzyme)